MHSSNLIIHLVFTFLAFLSIVSAIPKGSSNEIETFNLWNGHEAVAVTHETGRDDSEELIGRDEVVAPIQANTGSKLTLQEQSVEVESTSTTQEQSLPKSEAILTSTSAVLIDLSTSTTPTTSRILTGSELWDHPLLPIATTTVTVFNRFNQSWLTGAESGEIYATTTIQHILGTPVVVQNAPNLRLPQIHCKGHLFCGLLRSCDNAIRKVKPEDQFGAGVQHKSRYHTHGVCDSTCGVFVVADKKTHPFGCTANGTELIEAYNKIRAFGCRTCGAIERQSDLCWIKINRITGCKKWDYYYD